MKPINQDILRAFEVENVLWRTNFSLEKEGLVHIVGKSYSNKLVRVLTQNC